MIDQVFRLYTHTEHEVAAIKWQQRLSELAVQVDIEIVDVINAKFLRQHTDIALIVDAEGLWLSAHGMRMQPAWHEEIHRLKRASIKTELIARACQMGKTQTILDATAGLGHDGLLLAWLGAEVTLLERHPILFALLESSLEQAALHPILSKVVERIQLIHVEAEYYLSSLAPNSFDVIYLDPMFPQRDANQKQDKKQAQVKKQMQLLHLLLPDDGIMDLGENLLSLAQLKVKRVVVKRPRHAIFLDQKTTEYQWLGDACRFDGYLSLP